MWFDMAWLYLMLAGLLEIASTTALRSIDSISQVGQIVLFLALSGVSFYFLALSMSGIPLGTAYAVWTGVGALGTVLIGILYYEEPATTLRLVFLTTLIGSIIGLKFVSPE